jgi:hypothetical protein
MGRISIQLANAYGIHGAPIPEEIRQTASRGCNRLTNWDMPSVQMIRRVRLFPAALTIALMMQVPSVPAASAEPRVVAQGAGITVFEDAVARADGGTGPLLVVRLEPDRMTPAIVEKGDPPPEDAPWSVTINGSYFNEDGTPLYLLREGNREIAPFRKGTNAVFWCRNGQCAIQHATDFSPERKYDLAVQAAPRLMSNGNPTKGVRGADVVDGRAGLALASDGAVLVFATAPLSWGGLSFDAIRDFLRANFQSESILMLDGGNSARLTVHIGELTFSNGPFSREVPYSVRFKGR